MIISAPSLKCIQNLSSSSLYHILCCHYGKSFPFPPCCVLCCIAQSRPTLRDSMDCSLPGSSVHGGSPGKNTGVGCNALLQEIFPTQGSNPSLPHCRCILYCLNHQGSHLYFSEGVFLIHEIISLFKFYEYFNRFLKMDLGPFRNCVFDFRV